jgi:hypothetical protein
MKKEKGKRISLAPLSMDQALSGAMKVKVLRKRIVRDKKK